MLTFSKTVKNHITRHTQQTALTGRQNLPASTQLNKCNDPYQLDKLSKPHSLADEMFQTLTQLDKHNEPYWKIDQQSLHTIRQNEPHQANQLDKLNRPAKHLNDSTKSTDRFHRTL